MHAEDCFKRRNNVARKVYGRKEYMVEESFEPSSNRWERA